MFRSVFGRREDEERVEKEGRLPPGQSLTNRFPVLHYGPVPRLTPQPGACACLEKWSKRSPGRGRKFNKLPRTRIKMDIHCVTRWSKFDTEWEGISLRQLVDEQIIKLKPSARHLMQHCEYGFTVNIPLEVALAPNFLLATHYNGEPLEPDHGYPLAWGGRKYPRQRLRDPIFVEGWQVDPRAGIYDE